MQMNVMLSSRAVLPCRSLLLRNLLDHPPEEVRDRLFDPEPFELGGYLTAVVGRVIDNVAQYRPPRQGESTADCAQREDGVEPFRCERGTQVLEALIGAFQQMGHVVHRGQI